MPSILTAGRDATRPGCNVYHGKTTLHIRPDLINSDFDIVATGSATIQCQGMHDFYAIAIAIAKEAPAERLTSLRALAFDSGGKNALSLVLACMAQLKCQSLQCGAQSTTSTTLPEHAVALIRR